MSFLPLLLDRSLPPPPPKRLPTRWARLEAPRDRVEAPPRSEWTLAASPFPSSSCCLDFFFPGLLPAMIEERESSHSAFAEFTLLLTFPRPRRPFSVAKEEVELCLEAVK